MTSKERLDEIKKYREDRFCVDFDHEEWLISELEKAWDEAVKPQPDLKNEVEQLKTKLSLAGDQYEENARLSKLLDEAVEALNWAQTINCDFCGNCNVCITLNKLKGERGV